MSCRCFRHEHHTGRRHRPAYPNRHQRDIELFTEITGDRNPIHYDEDLAAAQPVRRVVVQGGVTSGLLNAVVAEQLPGPGSVFLEVAWRFRAPVRPGDEITAEVTVTSVREDKPITTLDHPITNQDGVVVLDGTAVVWRDPVVSPPPASGIAGKAAGRPTPSVLAHTNAGTTSADQEEHQ